MQIKWQAVTHIVTQRLLAARDKLPAERVFPIGGGSESRYFVSYLLPIAGLVGCAFLLDSTTNWQLRFPLIAAGALLLSWLASNIRRLVWLRRIHGGFAMVTPRLFILLDRSGVRTAPTWSFEGCTAKRSSGNDLQLQFKFGAATHSIPFVRSQKEAAERFVAWLAAFAKASAELLKKIPVETRLKSRDWKAWGDDDLFPEVDDAVKFGSAAAGSSKPLLRGITSRRVELAVLVLAVVALAFVVPPVIDRNAFLEASVIGTATAYRDYLLVNQNTRYRGVARARLTALYDAEIEDYVSQTASAPGASGFVEVLQYLRDHDVYVVPLVVEGESAVTDEWIPDLQVVSATPSFSDSRNRAREQSLISEVRQAIRREFPGDIFQIGGTTLAGGPSILVHYTYRNQPGSLYYPVRQEYLADEDRTWYYGIEIEWRLSLYVPPKPDPVHQFQLLSEPAPQFSSTSTSATSVYDAMAESAFDDFGDAFHVEFLEGS